MLKYRIPFYYIAIATLAGACISWLIISNPFKIMPAYASGDENNNSGNIVNCDYKTGRQNGYQHIKPLLFVEHECESASLDSIKQNIASLIESEKASGKIISASVYINVYTKGDWTSYNADETYHPASLNKVPVLITYMRMAEKDPSLLEQEIFFEKPDTSIPSQYYNSKTLLPAHHYSVRELLRYMIVYSDNDATTLLWKRMNFEYYSSTFTDLGLPKPSFKFDELQLSAKQYATFFRVLYNASYLSNAASEFCFSLLVKADFKEGLLKKLPEGLVVAHKFGECSYEVAHAAGEKPYGKLNELHEAAIVYNGNTPYLITVMTKGPDRTFLSDILGDISYIVYKSLSKAAMTGT